MKRSKKIIRTTLVASAVLAIAACVPEESGVNPIVGFSDVQDCIWKRPNDQTAEDWRKFCNDAYAEARKKHVSSAPRFTSKEKCEETEGQQCEVIERDGGSFFVPFMAGYLINTITNPNTGKTSYRSIPHGKPSFSSGPKSGTVRSTGGFGKSIGARSAGFGA